MKQTAVELLKQKLIKDQQNFPIYNKYINGVIDYLENQAKEMEKEQQGYSEEELLEHLNHLIMMPSSELDRFTNDEEMVTIKWFEQFRNK